eukprot:14800349-Alexandrium_andersonii.AAC.1
MPAPGTTRGARVGLSPRRSRLRQNEALAALALKGAPIYGELGVRLGDFVYAVQFGPPFNDVAAQALIVARAGRDLR